MAPTREVLLRIDSFVNVEAKGKKQQSHGTKTNSITTTPNEVIKEYAMESSSMRYVPPHARKLSKSRQNTLATQDQDIHQLPYEPVVLDEIRPLRALFAEKHSNEEHSVPTVPSYASSSSNHHTHQLQVLSHALLTLPMRVRFSHRRYVYIVEQFSQKDIVGSGQALEEADPNFAFIAMRRHTRLRQWCQTTVKRLAFTKMARYTKHSRRE